MGRIENRPMDYERAVVVDELQPRQTQTAPFRSERARVFKNVFDRADIVRDVRVADYTGVCDDSGPGQRELMQPGVLGFGLLQDGYVGVGVFPKCEEVLIGGAGFGSVT